MGHEKSRVYPTEKAGSLESRLRRWLQDPRKILRPYIAEGMTALDIGCGPGFFTLDMGRMVGTAGRVIAVDLQEGMLDRLRTRLQGTEMEQHITLHRCTEDRIGVTDRADFALCFYLLHELPDHEAFFAELHALLKPGGQALLVEPPLHVSREAFAATVEKARKTGFIPADGPKVFLGKSAILRKA